MITVVIKSVNGINRTVATNEEATWNDVFANPSVLSFFNVGNAEQLASALTSINGSIVPDSFRSVIVRSVVEPGSVAEIGLAASADCGLDQESRSADDGVVTVYTAGGLQRSTVHITPNTTTVAEVIHNDAVVQQSGMSIEQIDACAVMLNNRAVQPNELDTTTVSDGDTITLTVCVAYTKG